ncbi:helix-turn-helix transcriptional regulator [Candidatus Saccharibacteria bacterium]|nr:helix-turn-helix transcriptional regulator [Candidatus Saccharibacteria bacterium]
MSKLKNRLKTFTTFDDWRKEQMKDPEFVREYHKLDEEFELLEMILAARLEAELTQTQLAKKAGMKQEAIARIESGQSNPSYRTLRRVAAAMDKKIAFVKK